MRCHNIENTSNRIKPARGAAAYRKLAAENNHKNAFVISQVTKLHINLTTEKPAEDLTYCVILRHYYTVLFKCRVFASSCKLLVWLSK